MTRTVAPLVSVIAVILASLVTGALSAPASAASPGEGTSSDTSPNTTWAGQFYPVGGTTLPEECPPPTPNEVCDHFSLTIDLPPTFWDANTGQVTIRIEWPSSDNDFDLYVYGPDGGGLAGSSAAGGTTSEEVALLSPTPGTYEVRVVPFLVINSGYNGQASLFFTPGGPAPNPIRPTGGIAFAPSVIVDSQRTEGEPIVHVDRSGNIWESGPWGTSTSQSFIHKSVDAGDSYHVVSPIEARPDNPPGGGDTDVVTDDQGFAYFVDLEALANLGCSVSNDGGNTCQKNPIWLTSTGDDRQWFAVDNGPTGAAGDNTVFLTFRQVGTGPRVFSSPGSTGPSDGTGGLMYVDAANAPLGVTEDATCGQTRFDPVYRNLYLVCLRGDHIEVVRGHVNPSQRMDISFEVRALPASPGGIAGDIFPGIAVDADGNLYGTWIDEADHNVYVSVSRDRGTAWSAPLHVNGNPAHATVSVWSSAGAPGILALVWYGTSVRGDPDAFPSWYVSRQSATTVPWFTYFAQVNFDFTNPDASVIYQVRASEHPSHFGQICQGGLGCAASLAPPDGAGSIVWLTRWQSAAFGDDSEASFRIFYAGATSVAGGSPTFFSGTGTSAQGPVSGNGCVTTTPENCKIILYPQEEVQSGSFNQATGTIVIDVPPADIGLPATGTVLFSVTGLSFGEIAGDPLLQDVDATRAFDFVVGGGTAPVPRKVTGGGAIPTDQTGGEGHFNIVAHTDLKGKVDYIDDASELTFASAFISSVSVEGTKATIKGTGFANGAFTNFVVVVEDLSESGAGSDTFSISLEGYARSGVLLRGNIQIH